MQLPWQIPELETGVLGGSLPRSGHDFDLPAKVGLVRLPDQTDVYITPRVRKLIDTTEFRRLARISQLGLVREVYPGAQHTRHEHSLGVYRLATDFARALRYDEVAVAELSDQDITVFLAAALLHDIAHWPYCHPLEDMRLPLIQQHEDLASKLITTGEIAGCLIDDWSIDPHLVADVLVGTLSEPGDAAPSVNPIVSSLLSGPIDIDKMDYLHRDSLHAGVPYGRNFDRQRLIQSLCIDPAMKKLSISDKGRTAAEMMVFARYVMFSEVYWHHSVRSATAMIQRVAYRLLTEYKEKASDKEALLRQWQSMTESEFEQSILSASTNTSVASLADGLFGSKRRLFKRIAQFNCHEHADLHQSISHRPYPELVELGELLRSELCKLQHIEIGHDDILIDASPVKLEVQFKLSVRQSGKRFQPLSELSPVVRALATEQFDAVVKRVRVFCAPRLRDSLASVDIPAVLAKLL